MSRFFYWVKKQNLFRKKEKRERIKRNISTTEHYFPVNVTPLIVSLYVASDLSRIAGDVVRLRRAL